MKTWMVRAGLGGRFFDQFRSRAEVGIGWSKIGDVSDVNKREEIAARIQKVFPNYKVQQATMAAGQLFRFAKVFEIGDRIVTYDTSSRRYLCGIISGSYQHRPDATEEEFLNTRSVRWDHEKPRDELSEASKNSLGSISTIFEISEAVSVELWGKDSLPSLTVEIGSGVDAGEGSPAVDTSYEAMAELASEKLKDHVSLLDWEQMQDLVAGLLRSLGFKAIVSPSGPDRGKDIVASPDGFGFQDPRIVVEVKHRPNQRMGAPEIRSFLGGRHPRDKGLYVSTGGFSKDAYYEADRANIPLTLMDFEMLADAIIENYDKMDARTKQLIPLKPIFWLADQ